MIEVKAINSYSCKVKLGEGKEFTLTDNVVRDYVFLKRKLLVVRVGMFASLFITFAGFFLVFGMVGHSDFVTEMGIQDMWSAYDYAAQCLLSLLMIFVGSSASCLTYHYEVILLMELLKHESKKG